MAILMLLPNPLFTLESYRAYAPHPTPLSRCEECSLLTLPLFPMQSFLLGLLWEIVVSEREASYNLILLIPTASWLQLTALAWLGE